MVSINERADGRVEVIDDGLVLYCGLNREAAQLIAAGHEDRSPEAAEVRRVIADRRLPGAIDAMRLT